MSDSVTAHSHARHSFTKKKITVTFTVASGALGPSATDDTAVLEGHRCQVEIRNGGWTSAASLALRIEGMTLSMMNRLSVAAPAVSGNRPLNIAIANSMVLVEAGDDESGMATVFYGRIMQAFADFKNSPNVAFQVFAFTNYEAKATIIESRSFRGPTTAQAIFSDIATRAKLNFINRGVNFPIAGNVYLQGSVHQQLEKLHHDYQIPYALEGGSKAHPVTLKIWPPDLDIGEVNDPVRITSKTGLIGYPAYSQSGVEFTCFYNPNILYLEPIYLESRYAPEAWRPNTSALPQNLASSGLWTPFGISHSLESETPGGQWFTHVEAVRKEFSKQIVPTWL
ncbi:hypothetical protein [Brytella acorum]|nr:hypothetical protein [Brytella acorum]MDF3625783.1 hypothetical protein [Brytella acorum]